MAGLRVDDPPALLGHAPRVLESPRLPVLHRQVAERRDRVGFLPAPLLEEGDVAHALAAGAPERDHRTEVYEVGVEHLQPVASTDEPVLDALVDDAPVLQVRGAAHEPRHERGRPGPRGAREHLGRDRVEARRVVQPQHPEVGLPALHGPAHGPGGARRDALVGVELQDPVARRVLERQVPRGGEVVVPGAVVHPRTVSEGDLPGRIRGAGVHEHDLVDEAPHRGEAVGEHPLLVSRDHAQRELGHGQSLSNDGAAGERPAAVAGRRGLRFGGAESQPADAGASGLPPVVRLLTPSGRG